MVRVLARIFGLGGKMLQVIVDGGCRHRPQFSRGVWGHAPPPPPPPPEILSLLRVVLRHSETVSRSL